MHKQSDNEKMNCRHTALEATNLLLVGEEHSVGLDLGFLLAGHDTLVLLGGGGALTNSLLGVQNVADGKPIA